MADPAIHPPTTTGPQVTQHQIRQKGFASLDDLQSCKWHINKSPISHGLSALLSVKTMELCAKKVKTMELCAKKSENHGAC